MAFIDSENIIGTKEIGELFGISSSGVVNLQNRYPDFPMPIKRLESGPIFDLVEINEWGIQHNRIPIKNTLPIEAGTHKSIAFVGLPRTGKSYSSSVFAVEPECFVIRRAFSGAGDDFTQCAVKIITSSKITESYAQFNTQKEEERQYSRIEEESLINFAKEVNAYLKQKRELGEEISSEEYIEIFVKPSQLAMEIMNNNKLSYLIITDTPGVSDTYELVQIAEAHLVMLVLADSGGEVARKGFKKIVQKIAPLVAAGDACFLYNLKKPCDDMEEYGDMQKDAEIAMQTFEAEFAPLRKSIIDTSMNILNPSKSVLGIPGMKDRRINFAEKVFRERLQEIINCSFKGEGLEFIEKELEGCLKEELIAKGHMEEYAICENFIRFLREELVKIPRLESDIAKPDYIATFKSKNHARVKTQDGYRIVNAVSIERHNALQNLYQFFSSYTVQNTPDLLTQAAVKLFYSIISEELKNDAGLGMGIHPWEDYPPITMRAIEYIFAADLENALVQGTVNAPQTYCDTLKNNGIVSKSWNCVRLDLNNQYILTILTNCGVLALHSSDLKELVRNRYIGGLRKIGEYKAWKQCLSIFSESIVQNYAAEDLVKSTGI